MKLAVDQLAFFLFEIRWFFRFLGGINLGVVKGYIEEEIYLEAEYIYYPENKRINCSTITKVWRS